jgi:orotidine-5'-phosphate decarboxylase
MAGKAGSDLKLLAVTVMTSYDDRDLIEAGYNRPVADLVSLRAQTADRIGIDGLILSPEEVEAMRTLLGPRMELITPGIRPAEAAIGDQKRIMTPFKAIKAGADRLVIGRPITQNPDPKAAAQAILAEITTATS